MSTKVYNAYRLSKRIDLAKFMHMLQYTGTENVEGILRNEHHRWMQTAEVNSQKYRDIAKKYPYLNDTEREYSPKQIDQFIRNEMASDLMEAGYKESDSKGLRSPFNYDASVTFRELNGYWYMQVFADWIMKNVFDFVTTSYPGVKDYHYQDSCDKPNEVNDREWRERRKIWDTLYEGRPFGRKDYLSLTVMDVKEFKYWLWPYVGKVAEQIREGKLIL